MEQAMILDERQIEHIRKIYKHMNTFALAKSVENLLETVGSLKARVYLLENPPGQTGWINQYQEKKS